MQLIQETEDELQDFKTRKIQKRKETDDKTTEVEEIRKELGKMNKASRDVPFCQLKFMGDVKLKMVFTIKPSFPEVYGFFEDYCIFNVKK